MYYYMILVLDPDFSAEEIRDAKRLYEARTPKARCMEHQAGPLPENEVAATKSGMER